MLKGNVMNIQIHLLNNIAIKEPYFKNKLQILRCQIYNITLLCFCFSPVQHFENVLERNIVVLSA